MNQVITVSQLNQYLKALIDSDELLQLVTIKGEISNFTNHIKSGHFYFTLKDATSSIRAVMFRMNAQRVRFDVQNGMNVIITGSVRVFERDGAVQLYCDEMQPDGIGALYLAYEQMKERLEKQGYFDVLHKKEIPLFPKKIGVITSKTGAALQDIINVLSRRYPIATLVLIPALVQGELAPESICDGIAMAQNQTDLDVLIVGRGGGSLEDLWAFNDERVAMAIFHCTIPIISAVGHEIDFTISDFVADLRAPTPSAAAELCAPDIRELEQRVLSCATQLEKSQMQEIQTRLKSLEQLTTRLQTQSPNKQIVRNAELLQAKKDRLILSASQIIKQKNEQYLKQVAMLEALSPLKVLTRGYSITYKEDEIIADVAVVQSGDIIKTRLSNGTIYSTVDCVNHSD